MLVAEIYSIRPCGFVYCYGFSPLFIVRMIFRKRDISRGVNDSILQNIPTDTSKIVTISTAAKQLKISRQAAWEAVANGRLKTVDIDGITFVTVSGSHGEGL